MRAKVICFILLIVLMINGCGGGGGGSSSFTEGSNNPVFTSKNQTNVVKTKIDYFSFDINVSDASSVQFHISGEDADVFNIDELSGILTFNMDKYSYKQVYYLIIIVEDALGHQETQNFMVIVVDSQDEEDVVIGVRDFEYKIENNNENGSSYVHISSTVTNGSDFLFYDNNEIKNLDSGTVSDGYVTLGIGKHIIKICEANSEQKNCSLEKDIIVSKQLESSDYSRIPINNRSGGLTNDGSSNLVYGTTDGKIYSVNPNNQSSNYIGDVGNKIGGLSAYEEQPSDSDNTCPEGYVCTSGFAGDVSSDYGDSKGTQFIVYTDPTTGNIYYADIDKKKSNRIASTPFPDGLDVVGDKIYVVTNDNSGVLTIFSYRPDNQDMGRELGKLDTGIDDIVGISHSDNFLYILSESGKIYQTDIDTGESIEIFNNDNLFGGDNSTGGLEAITILNNRIYISYINDSSIYAIHADLRDYEVKRGSNPTSPTPTPTPTIISDKIIDVTEVYQMVGFWKYDDNHYSYIESNGDNTDLDRDSAQSCFQLSSWKIVKSSSIGVFYFQSIITNQYSIPFSVKIMNNTLIFKNSDDSYAYIKADKDIEEVFANLCSI